MGLVCIQNSSLLVYSKSQKVSASYCLPFQHSRGKNQPVGGFRPPPACLGLMQKYNSVSKDVREQIKWLCLFFTKDKDSFEDCLRENDVIPDKSERDRLKKCLQDRPYSKLILKCYQPTGYHLL